MRSRNGRLDRMELPVQVVSSVVGVTPFVCYWSAGARAVAGAGAASAILVLAVGRAADGVVYFVAIRFVLVSSTR